MHIDEIKKRANAYIMNTYGDRDICAVKGEGVYLWDSEGKKYLDCIAGIGVCNLGHCHPAIVDAVTRQVSQLIHCSNLYYIEPQIELARMLCEHSFADKCFFANTGAEANEGAIKLARYYSKKKYAACKCEFITFFQSFHGRTMGMITATAQEKFQKGFEPLLPGFKYATFNDIDSVRAQVNENTCAIMIEPVQGEGGVIPATKSFMHDLRQLCDEQRIVLIFDEVQCGLGRTGTNFAYEYYDVKADIVTLAKALGGGLPIGALLAAGDVAEAFDVGKHATTFGGNPLVTSAAVAYLNELFGRNLAQHAAEVGAYFKDKLTAFKNEFSIIKDVRGLGLMLAIEYKEPLGKTVYRHCLEEGLLVNAQGDTRTRLLPPLIITREQVDTACDIIRRAIAATVKNNK